MEYLSHSPEETERIGEELKQLFNSAVNFPVMPKAPSPRELEKPSGFD